MASNKPHAPNIYAYRGRHLLSVYNDKHTNVAYDSFSELKLSLKNPPIPLISLGSIESPPAASLRPVCIIGAGVAGLYTAMIFESLKISYHVIDADTRERIGGRMFTYKFPNSGPYDYYDIGAMRFPDTPFMKRTFDLARNRGLKGVKLIPYIMEMVEPPNTWLFFNNVRVHNRANPSTEDPFKVKDYIADKSLTTPRAVSQKVREVLQPFRDMFRPLKSGESPPDIATSMKILFKETNKFSMRSYMLIMKQMDPKDVNWCESLDKPTGWYDRALTQVVLEDMASNWPTTPRTGPEEPKPPNEGWYCLDGGSSTLPRAMFASLSEKAQGETLFRSPVTAISRDPEKEVMRVSINGKQSTQEYSAVICTVPLPRLSLMDLTGADIHDNYARWSAIRVLQYGPAIKIGVKFSSAWWETLPKPIHGGQSYTDRPCRTIVYPSYPQDQNPENRSKVLIVSYCRTEDASRLSALIHPDGTAEPELIDLVFRDLAAVHNVTVNEIKTHYKTGDYFAWSWSQDPLTMGGYAFFGPGVYGNADVYGELLKPAARGKLFFAGEATSACHAWVAGALDSAWRAVDQYLTLNDRGGKRELFHTLWGKTEYWDETTKNQFEESDCELMEKFLQIALNEDMLKTTV